MACGKSGAIPRAAPRGARALSVRPSPRHRGTQEQERSTSLLLRQGLPRSSFAPGSLSAAASGAQEKARRGARRMRARSLSVHGRTVSEPPERCSRSHAGMDARATAAARVPFSLVTFSWASKRK